MRGPAVNSNMNKEDSSEGDKHKRWQGTESRGED